MDWQILFADSPEQKSEAAACILRALPQWFGNVAAREEYIQNCAQMTVLLACEGQQHIGFLTLRETSPVACEVHVMGILPQYHRRGVGAALMRQAIAHCKEQGYALLHVKTLDASADDPGYARTRAFYRAQGFLPMECLPTYWDADNPCLWMVLPLGGPA